MKISLFSLVILLITGLVASEVSPNTTETTTEVPTTAPTGTPTTSTGAPTTSSSAAPTTTSTGAPPTTTTEDPITTTTEVTTSKTPDTTLPPPTTTKSPEPGECSFNITQSDATCILADLKVSFIVPLEGKDKHINLGCNATYESSDCSSNDTQTLILYESTYNFTMVFAKDDKEKFYVKEIIFRYNLDGEEGMVSSNSTKIFSVKTGKSYLCKTKADVKIDNVTIEFSEIHVQAFISKGDTEFGAAEECDADDKVSDVVPIAVGVALAALIIVVLIAYLVGRRRSRQSGYQSV